MNRRALFSIAMVAAFVTVTAPALAENKPSLEVLSEITLDIDNDGKMDRAVLVRDPEIWSYVDLYIYLAAGDEKLDLSRKPAFLKKEIAEDSINLGLESKGKGSLIVKSGCGGCRKSNETTLTIVHRGGEFLVAGFTSDWEWANETSGEVTSISIGSCDINFLSGKGVASQGLGKVKPVRRKFTPIKLADWSGEPPKACKF